MNTYQTDHMHLLWAAIDAWNADCPPGTPVLFTSGLESSMPVASETTSEAYEDGCRAFIRVKHAALPVPLSSVSKLQK